ncbi:MAG: hypothetical protein FWC96_07695 [Oscillospiraceae bacterium]|nr:hypothetical protein [Oscillospiraceae bacterium]
MWKKHKLKIIGAMLLIILIPSIIDLVFWLGGVLPLAIPTSFSRVDILGYVGAMLPIVAAVALGVVVYLQSEKLDAIDTKIANDNMAYNTFTYLSIEKMKITPEETEESHILKSYELKEAVPWPLDVRGAYLGYPNGNIPRELEKCVPPFPLGNSEDFQEEVIAEKVFFGYKKKNSESYPSIDPSIGIFASGTTHPELVLWQGDFPLPRYYPYYMPFGIQFFAKSSRDFFVSEVEISDLHLKLIHNKNLYRFESRINRPLILKTHAISDDLDAIKDGYNHIFGMTIHLCHSHNDLLGEAPFDNMYLIFDITYVNLFGVKTKCQQQVAVRGELFQDQYVKLTLINSVGLYETEEIMAHRLI